MAIEDRFKQAVIVTLAKRAANRCSNPDCGAITSGPTDDPKGSINVGEAAHIYGANVGSARYDPAMSPADRSDITNAIWLCSNCHKLVDDDPARFPAGLLFEWQRAHEQRIAETIGKAGADVRRRYEERHLEEFGRLSYRAERIILEKGRFWEYRLTAEVLRFEMAPALQRWDALRRGLYMKPNYFISKFDTPMWISTKMAEIIQITNALSELMNVEFDRAWGERGVPGVDTLIVSTCRLYSGVCSSAIDWEEAVRFVKVDEIFKEVKELLTGVAGGLIDEAAKVPAYLSDVFASEPEPGIYHLNITLKLPDGWSEALNAALARATDALLAG